MGFSKKERMRCWLASLPQDRVFTASEALALWLDHNENCYMDKKTVCLAINRSGMYVQLRRSRSMGADAQWIGRAVARGNEEAMAALSRWTDPCPRCAQKRECARICASRRRFNDAREVIG